MLSQFSRMLKGNLVRFGQGLWDITEMLALSIRGRRVNSLKEYVSTMFQVQNSVQHQILVNVLKKDIRPIFGPDRAGDIKHSNADISKARELLGYDPDYNFEDGLKLAIEWYKENL